MRNRLTHFVILFSLLATSGGAMQWLHRAVAHVDHDGRDVVCSHGHDHSHAHGQSHQPGSDENGAEDETDCPQCLLLAQLLAQQWSPETSFDLDDSLQGTLGHFAADTPVRFVSRDIQPRGPPANHL